MSIQIQLPELERNLEIMHFGAEKVKEYKQTQLEQRLYTITNRLLTSLEVDRCVEIFMQAVAEDMMFDGFHYSLQLPEPAINLRFGRESRHTCSYNLKIEDINLGELTLYRGRRFSQQELTHLENLLCVLVHPLRNAIMYRKALLMSQIDALTGLNNRASFDREMTREISNAERYSRPLSLLMVDIDFFKKINDTHGHAAGDAVLKSVADCMKVETRGGDVLFRYGGEEFAVILADVDINIANTIGERIRGALKEQMIRFNNIDIDITVSVGVATYNNGEALTELFDRADKALYKAKESGRDQVQVGI